MLLLIMSLETILPHKFHITDIARTKILIDRLLQSGISEEDIPNRSFFRRKNTSINKVNFLIRMCAEVTNDIGPGLGSGERAWGKPGGAVTTAVFARFAASTSVGD